MGERPLRIGLIGCGAACAHHVSALLQLERAQITAVADQNEQRARNLAGRYGFRHIFADATALIEADVADVVGVLTSPASHRSIAQQAMDAGLHVLLEKPAGLSLDDADALVATAARNKVCAMMSFHMRWHRLIARAREEVCNGELGVVESIRSVWNSPLEDDAAPHWKTRRDEGGGVLFESAVHLFDVWRYLLNDDIQEVFAWSRSGVREDESAGIMAKLASGVVAIAQASGRTAHNIEIEVSGSRGRLRVCGQRFDGYERLSKNETSGMMGPRLRGLRNFCQELPTGLVGMRRLGDYGDSYREMWRHMIDCVENGRPNSCSMADGREALRAVMAAAASANENRPISIANAPATVSGARLRVT